MKFLSFAVAAVLGLSEGKKVLDKQGLIRAAIPVDKHGNRRTMEQRQLDQEEFQISYYQSIQFSQCLSLKTYPDEEGEEIMFNYLADYAAEGKVVSEKSYVLFNVCKTGYCDYEDESNMFMTDLATYMQFLVEYLPQQHENYCKACEEAENYCKYYRYGVNENGEALEEEGAEEEAAEEDGGRRRTRQNVQVQYIDCDTCEAEECWEDENQNNNNNNGQQEEQGLDVIAEWAQNIAECQQSEVMYNNQYNLYAGFMCNQEGNGVEVGVFMDEECSLYTSLKQYADIMDYNDKYAYYNSQEIVTLPFSQSFDCSENVEYRSPYGDEEEEQEENNNGEEPEANEYCQRLFDEDTVDLATCGANGNNNNNNNQNQPQHNYNVDWYSYVLDNEGADEIWAVCEAIKNFEGNYEPNVYNPDDSGSFYVYPSTGKKGTSPGAIFGIILLVVAVVGVAIYVVMSTQKKRGDAKKVPLVSGGKGAMA